LRFLRFGEPLGGHVGRPEGLRDDDVRIDQLALELAVRTVLVGRDDIVVTAGLEELAQAELARNAAEQLARPEVDRFRRGQGLAVRVALDLRQIVAWIAGRIAAGRIVVEDAEDFRHGTRLSCSPWNGTRLGHGV
jgi:hypothetical protein